MSRILVVDDEPILLALASEILSSAGYDVLAAESVERALDVLDDEAVSLVVSDVVMPGLSGIELLGLVAGRRASLPVLLVTGEGTYGRLTEALASGAAGLLVKPFSHDQLLDAVATALERAVRSEEELRARLLAPTLGSALANAIEASEASLHGHCERLASLATTLAAALDLRPGAIENVRLGAILHDVGKIGIPDRILEKPGPLDDDELALMKTHTLIGDRLLEPLDLLEDVRPIVRHHHERWDGAGYPDGLAGGAIPLSARIVSVADAIEAMSAHRVYRAALPLERIVQELVEGRGTQWDPHVVDLALGLVRSSALQECLELAPEPAAEAA